MRLSYSVLKSKRFYFYIEHLLFAFLVASFLEICDHYDYLAGLDSLMLRIGQSRQLIDENEKCKAPSVKENSIKKKVHVIAIGDEYYERFFRQQSPLDRKKLKEVLSKILVKNPDLLAIDLDLSPGEKKTEAEVALYKMLKEGPDGLNKAKIILIPFVPVSSPELFRPKMDWMIQSCKKDNIEFAFPNLYSHQSTVLFYNKNSPTIGLVATGKLEKMTSVCDQIETLVHVPELEAPEFYREILKQGSGDLSPINFNATDQIDITLIKSEDDFTQLGDLTGKVVFFGAGYGINDQYITPLCQRYGVMLHAAIFNTAGDEIKHNKVIAYFIDVVLGFLLALLFSFLWKNHAVARGKPNSYCKAVVWWTCGVLLLLALITTCLYMASIMLKYNLWLNPGIMVLSICIKSYTARIEHSEPQKGSHPDTLTGFFSTLNPQNIDIGWYNAVLKDVILILKTGIICYGLFKAFWNHP